MAELRGGTGGVGVSEAGGGPQGPPTSAQPPPNASSTPPKRFPHLFSSSEEMVRLRKGEERQRRCPGSPTPPQIAPRPPPTPRQQWGPCVSPPHPLTGGRPPSRRVSAGRWSMIRCVCAGTDWDGLGWGGGGQGGFIRSRGLMQSGAIPGKRGGGGGRKGKGGVSPPPPQPATAGSALGWPPDVAEGMPGAGFGGVTRSGGGYPV